MKRAAIEILLILLNSALFVVCDTVLHAKGPVVAATGVFWIGYLITRLRQEPGTWRKWGLGLHGFWPATIACVLAVLTGSAGMICYGLRHGGVSLPPTFWVLILLYLPWGLLQQFLLNAMVAANVIELLAGMGIGVRMRTLAAVTVSSALFGTVHLPDRTLTALCCCAGVVWVAIYLRWRNLWPLGVSHVALGAIAYYVILRRDPLAEIIRTLHVAG